MPRIIDPKKCRPRGKVYPMSETSLDGCDVVFGVGLFSPTTYIPRVGNIQRDEDSDDEVIYLFKQGDSIIGNVPFTLYLEELEKCMDHKQVRRAANTYCGRLKVQRRHPVKLVAAYIKTRITIIKWWMR